jgi:hypothetical protein
MWLLLRLLRLLLPGRRGRQAGADPLPLAHALQDGTPQASGVMSQ